MQKLTLHPAWDKTIADQDWETIKQSFQEAILVSEMDIQFTSLWQAKNHHDELLITVLIHNSSQQDCSFENQLLTYSVNGSILAKQSFSVPKIIGKRTSMPWTFIFNPDYFNPTENYKDGIINLIRNDEYNFN